jgi:outer membrane protein assembly factor BamC
MGNFRKFIVFVVVFALLSGLAACSAIRSMDQVVTDKRVEYKSARSLPPLEVPPDLAAPAEDTGMSVPESSGPKGATYSGFREQHTGALAPQAQTAPSQIGAIRVERDGALRWLLIPEPPAAVWPKVRDFLVKNGLSIKVEDPRLGIIETDWAENRADIPQGFIRSALGKIGLEQVYSAATRDKYRIRLEQGKTPDTTELYLTQRGMEEVAQGDSTIWQARPNDPELEAEMLKRLMVYLGVEEQKAGSMLAAGQRPGQRAQLTHESGGRVFVTLDEDFSQAWRRTGLALDRASFTVEDRDRSRGLYYVRYREPGEGEKKGLLSKLAFWRHGAGPTPDEYLVRLTSDKETTHITVLDKNGKEDDSKTAERILSVLYDQLK